ncbi:hypothetical protein K4K60_000891 [Colletotrichum sp. SAR11_57]|nr:hypothetical protein K4K60_000891 [Colletotrichum sp. SAR11_57]
MVAGCADFYFVVENDTCADIADRWGVSVDNLYAWNPDVKTDCSGLIAGDYHCHCDDYKRIVRNRPRAYANGHSC